MRAKAFTLILLFLLAFSLSAGAHPCGDGGEASTQAAVPPCHGEAPAPETPEDGADCGDHPCSHVCHLMAVTALTPSIAAIGPVAEVPVPETRRSLPALAQSIDHVPLD